MQELELNEKEEFVKGKPRSMLKKVVDHHHFQSFIIGLILLNGIIVVAKTYPIPLKDTLHILDRVLVWTFVVEMIIKMVGFGLLGRFTNEVYSSSNRDTRISNVNILYLCNHRNNLF